jgi:nicotinate-nucleotide adenylyltransferase
MIRLGLQGGTFDPIHFGHLRLAEEARQTFGLDKIIFIPARISPLKRDEHPVDVEERVLMTKLAIAGNPFYELSRIEVDREGPSFSVDTLQALHALHPHSELFFMMGADAAIQLPNWREPETILKLAKVVVSRRPGVSRADLERQLPKSYLSQIEWLDMLPIDISSSAIREMVSAGRSIRYLTSDPVVQYISERGLYLGENSNDNSR